MSPFTSNEARTPMPGELRRTRTLRSPARSRWNRVNLLGTIVLLVLAGALSAIVLLRPVAPPARPLAPEEPSSVADEASNLAGARFLEAARTAGPNTFLSGGGQPRTR
jgi:hypothetical protein